MTIRKSWLRGALTLAVLGLVAGALIASPVGAAKKGVTKAKAKKISRNIFNQLIGSATAGNADKLDNLDSAELFAADSRVAFVDDTDDVDVPTVDGTALTTSITVPAPGFLILQAGGDWYNLDSTNFFSCAIALDGADLESSFRFVAHNASTQQGPDSSADTEAPIDVNDDEDCTTETVAPVTAGVHTVSYKWFDAAPGDTIYNNVILIAEYVPFNATGARPRSFSVARDEGGDPGR